MITGIIRIKLMITLTATFITVTITTKMNKTKHDKKEM